MAARSEGAQIARDVAIGIGLSLIAPALVVGIPVHEFIIKPIAKRINGRRTGATNA